ncbi:MAG: BrnT family toxin [Phycisphaerae bacterium]|nr:BrnT family toxin [Phycisphaerae bacterium]
MDFEYDRNKSDANKEKHGIDFEEAQALWLDENRAVVRTRCVSERRDLVIGRIGGVYWTAVVTSRGDAIRIISVRRSRKTEKDIYDG